jgi:hypothetical protein
MAQSLITIDSDGIIEDLCCASWELERFCDPYKAGIELDKYTEDGCSFVSVLVYGNREIAKTIEKSEIYKKAYSRIQDNF